MVEESKKMQYWLIALLIIFVIMIVVTYFVSGGFANLGTRVLLPILDAIFGSGSTTNLVIQGVISVIVVIILVLCLWFGRKKEWL